MTKKLSITHGGVTFTEGDRIKMISSCQDVAKGEICVLKHGLPNGSGSGELWAYGKRDQCSCIDKWKLIPKQDTEKTPKQKRTSNGRFAGKEDNTIIHRPAPNSVWKDTVKESEHPWGMRVTPALIAIGGAYDLDMTPLAAKDLQKKLQLALEKHKLLFNQEKE